MNNEDILRIDRKHIWHPFTQMKDYQSINHIAIKKAKGIKLYDYDGNSYYDTISSWWTNLHGHCNPYINKAIKRQLKKIEHVNFSGFTHKPAAKLVKLLSDHLDPSLSRFFFSDNGSTATEVALKLSFQYFKNIGLKNKSNFVYFKNSYHGDTVGAVSVGGIGAFHDLYNELRFKSYEAPSPDCSCCLNKNREFTGDPSTIKCNMECFAGVESLVIKNADSIAAVIIEPIVQCAGGILCYPPEFLNRLKAVTEQNNIHLIFDEVATGFGRTGEFFAYQHTDITPDFICLSKGLSGGYMPLALTVTTDRIYQGFYADYNENKTFYHGHSYTANPIACSSGVASLELFNKYNLPYSKKDVIKNFHDKLDSFSGYDFIGDIRYTGFIGAVQLVKSREQKQNLPQELRVGYRIYNNSLKAGLVLRPLGDIIYWFLPLAVTKQDVSKIMELSINVITDTMKEVIQEVSSDYKDQSNTAKTGINFI